MNAADRDEEFEAFLKRRSMLSGAADKLEPPDELDEIVLNKAREAINAQRRPARAARWAAPLAIAATVLLCFSVVLNVALNTNRPDMNSRRLTAGNAVTEQKAQPEPAIAPSPTAPAPRQSLAPVPTIAPPQSLAQSQAAAAAPSPAAPAHAGPREPVPNAAPYVADSVARASADAARSESEALSGDVARPEAGVRQSFSARSAARAAGSSPTPGARPESEMDSAQRAASGSPGDKDRRTADQASGSLAEAPALAKRKADVVNHPEGPEVASPPQAATPPQAASPSSGAPPHPSDPKVWLRQIEALRSKGKAAQADAEMQRFRAAFPGYRVEGAGDASH